MTRTSLKEMQKRRRRRQKVKALKARLMETKDPKERERLIKRISRRQFGYKPEE